MAVENALKAVENILDTTRHPILAENAGSHTYEDKFAMVEVMTNTAVASLVTVLEQFGIKDLETPLGWVQNDKRVKLRFQMDKKCAFVKKTQREIVTSEHKVEKHVDVQLGNEAMMHAVIEQRARAVGTAVHVGHDPG